MALLRRSAGGQRGNDALPYPRFHADLELVAEQAARSRVRSGTLRRTVPERRSREGSSRLTGCAGRGLLPARQGQETGAHTGLTETSTLQRRERGPSIAGSVFCIGTV